MVISVNPNPHKEEFNSLLESTMNELNKQAKLNASKVSKLTGNKLEPYVKDIMSEFAVGTNFENSIELIGGQKFPDIVANKFYGVEVKTTTKNHWRTTGNSVLESTRIADVERIFMLFGKLGSPIEFKCRPYEECLSEVVVTHSPRYLIDMNLEEGKTIFDKLKIPYDNLRRKDNPIKPIINYYKSRLKPGQDLWWIDQESEQSSNLVIDIWSNLDSHQKNNYITKAMLFFPEIFSNKGDKFSRFAIWLVTREAVVCPNIRDLFTAGGKQDIIIKNKSYIGVSQIFTRLFNNIDNIIELIINTPVEELNEFWNSNIKESQKINKWIDLVAENSKTINAMKKMDVEFMLKNLIK